MKNTEHPKNYEGYESVIVRGFVIMAVISYLIFTASQRCTWGYGIPETLGALVFTIFASMGVWCSFCISRLKSPSLLLYICNAVWGMAVFVIGLCLLIVLFAVYPYFLDVIVIAKQDWHEYGLITDMLYETIALVGFIIPMFYAIYLLCYGITITLRDVEDIPDSIEKGMLA